MDLTTITIEQLEAFTGSIFAVVPCANCPMGQLLLPVEKSALKMIMKSDGKGIAQVEEWTRAEKKLYWVIRQIGE